MKRRVMLLMFLMIAVMLGSYGFAFAGAAGGEGSGCPDTLPSPTSGPFLTGTFTVAQDKEACKFGPNFCYYDVHVVLNRFLHVHLFSFPAPLASKDLCDLTPSELKENFAMVPCTLAVQDVFGIAGTPVIKDIMVLKKDFCNSPDEMIMGTVLIRVVP